MAKKKKEKIRYRFLKSKMGVHFKGLYEDLDKPDFEELPRPLAKVLEDYGFLENTPCLYEDEMEPRGWDVPSELDDLAMLAIVRLAVKPGRKRNTYFAQIDEASMRKGKTLGDALYRAFMAWNAEERPIGGIRFTTALERVLSRVNARRG